MAEASASGGRAAGGGGAIGDGFTNLAAEDSEDELRSSEWEARLASGDLPEDFLRVTEPKAENRDDFAFPWNKQQTRWKAAWPVYESDFEIRILSLADLPCIGPTELLNRSDGSNQIKTQMRSAQCGRGRLRRHSRQLTTQLTRVTTRFHANIHDSQFSRVPESPLSGDSCRMSIHSSTFQFDSSIEY